MNFASLENRSLPDWLRGRLGSFEEVTASVVGVVVLRRVTAVAQGYRKASSCNRFVYVCMHVFMRLCMCVCMCGYEYVCFYARKNVLHLSLRLDKTAYI